MRRWGVEWGGGGVRGGPWLAGFMGGELAGRRSLCNEQVTITNGNLVSCGCSHLGATYARLPYLPPPLPPPPMQVRGHVKVRVLPDPSLARQLEGCLPPAPHGREKGPGLDPLTSMPHAAAVAHGEGGGGLAHGEGGGGLAAATPQPGGAGLPMAVRVRSTPGEDGGGVGGPSPGDGISEEVLGALRARLEVCGGGFCCRCQCVCVFVCSWVQFCGFWFYGGVQQAKYCVCMRCCGEESMCCCGEQIVDSYLFGVPHTWLLVL
jgi:hypothetical protein